MILPHIYPKIKSNMQVHPRMHLEKTLQNFFSLQTMNFDLTKPKRIKKYIEDWFKKFIKNARGSKLTLFCNQHVNKPWVYSASHSDLLGAW